MSYQSASSTGNELVFHQARISLWPYAIGVVIALMLALSSLALSLTWLLCPAIIYTSEFLVIALIPAFPTLALSLAWLLRLAIIYFTSEFLITEKRVLAKTGFIKRNASEIIHGKIEGVNFEQGYIGRIFNYGSIVVTGTGDQQVAFIRISKPLKCRQILMQLMEGERPSRNA